MVEASRDGDIPQLQDLVEELEREREIVLKEKEEMETKSIDLEQEMVQVKKLKDDLQREKSKTIRDVIIVGISLSPDVRLDCGEV